MWAELGCGLSGVTPTGLDVVELCDDTLVLREGMSGVGGVECVRERADRRECQDIPFGVYDTLVQ